MQRTIILISFLFFSFFCAAQSKEHFALLDKKKAECENILAAFTGKPETFDQLIKEGNAGLAITNPEDHEYKFAFHQAIGTGYYYKQDFKGAKDNYEQAYTEASKANLVEKSTKPLGALVSIYHYMGLPAKADSAVKKLELITEATDTLKNKSDIYYNLGLYYQQQKFFYNIALSNFLKSAELHKPVADTTKILKKKLDYGTKLMMVAEIYLYLKQPEKSLQYLEEVKQNLNLSLIVDITAYGKFIRSYVQLNNKPEALKYYNLLQQTAEKSPGKWSELVSSNLEMAALELKTKNYELAKSYIDKADKQSKLDNKEILTSAVNLSYGDYYKSLNDYGQAAKYYKIAELGSAIYNKEQYADLLRSLTSVAILSNSGDAGIYFNKYIMISDSLTQGKIASNLAEMEAQYQNKNKQEKINVLSAESIINNLEIKNANRQRIFFIIAFILLLGIITSVIMMYRNKQKSSRLLQKKNEEMNVLNENLEKANITKAKLFSIISHDLRSPISQVYQFLDLQKTNPGIFNEEEKQKHNEQISVAAGVVLETMEDLLIWSKTQMQQFSLTKEPVNASQCVHQIDDLLHTQLEKKKIKLSESIDPLITMQTDKNIITIIIRNLLQNAITYSPENSTISISARQQNNSTQFLISDEGAGMPERIRRIFNEPYMAVNSNQSGLGLTIVKEMAELIQANIEISSNKPVGTLITISVPDIS
jgi:signal transduction histidine kinase